MTSMAEYVADDVGAPVPTLNASVARCLLTRSPLHAWSRHPKLNPAREPETSAAFDLGTAVHALLLEGRDVIDVCPFNDWRTSDAKNMRDAAREAGKIPLLPSQAETAIRMAQIAHEAMASCPEVAPSGGDYVPEQTYVYQYEGTWLRCRPDLVSPDGAVVLSYKTAESAEPDTFSRRITDYGYEMQAAFESNAIEARFGVEPRRYIWIVQESSEPYAVSFIAMSELLRTFAQERFEMAVSIWADCLARNRWPGYPARVRQVDAAPWALAQWEETKAIRELQEAFA